MTMWLNLNVPTFFIPTVLNHGSKSMALVLSGMCHIGYCHLAWMLIIMVVVKSLMVPKTISKKVTAINMLLEIEHPTFQPVRTRYPLCLIPHVDSLDMEHHHHLLHLQRHVKTPLAACLVLIQDNNADSIPILIIWTLILIRSLNIDNAPSLYSLFFFAWCIIKQCLEYTIEISLVYSLCILRINASSPSFRSLSNASLTKTPSSVNHVFTFFSILCVDTLLCTWSWNRRVRV